MNNSDKLTIKEFCRILCAESWTYSNPPSFYYKTWETYQKFGKSKHYYWDNCRYADVTEAHKRMAKYIHDLYGRISGRNVVQLTINWL